MIKRGLVLLVLGLVIAMLDWWIEPSIEVITGDEVITGKENAAPVEPAGNSTGRLEQTPCWFNTGPARPAECAHWYTETPDGQFRLAVVVIKAPESHTTPTRAKAPVFYLVGGPGNSSFLEPEEVEDWFYWHDTAQLQRDLVLVDQRGTGLSTPQYYCSTYKQLLRQLMGESLTVEQELQQYYAGVAECLATAKSMGFDPGHYNTSLSARDMQGVAQALGYQRWHVVGSSYGTRLALEWARLYPESIASLVLDAVYPPSENTLLEWPELLHQSFARFWDKCATLGACDDGQTLEKQFWQRVAQLDQQPLHLSVPLWYDDWSMPVELTGQRLITVVFQALYSPHLYPTIVSAIEQTPSQHQAVERLAANAVNSELSTAFNPLTFFAVECSETPAVDQAAFAAMVRQFPRFMNYTAPAAQYDVCQLFPAREDLAEFRRPVQLKQPVLIVSGGMDPVTPASWAEALAARLANARHWHYPELGHGVIESRECVHQSLENFFQAPDHSLPQPEC